MKLSRQWLSEFTKIEASDKEYADRMTMSGSKVEGIEITGGRIKNIVCGRVETIERHPDSTHLWVLSLDAGTGERLTIVTGAQNVSAGDMVPAALDGSTLADGKEIKAGKIRGVLSQGMLCSLGELGLDAHDYPDADEDGIFILRQTCDVGDSITKVLGLGDSVVDFEITNNRPDCLSVIGLARESAATFKTGLTLHTPKPKCECGGDISDFLSVELADPELCSRYSARIVKDIKIAPSPDWMRRRLRASGIRPINNIVDITNYVMLEYGQPMHAFDYSCVSKGRIVVRRAKPGELITTLDGTSRVLSGETLLITDIEKAIGIAGVMGGENSEITENTKTIVFESACFDGTGIRKTSIALGFRTDASGRYEKGLDPRGTIPALNRACELVELIGAGAVVPGVIDQCGSLPPEKVLPLEPGRINRLLGTDISEEQMEDILKSLGFILSGGYITVPTWRRDIDGFADIAEEIARLYGYDLIEPKLFLGGAEQGGYSPWQSFEIEADRLCRSMGYNEIVSYSFASPVSDDRILLPKDSPLRRHCVIQNPLGEDTSLMRTSPLPSMLGILAGNFSKRNENVRLYELAAVYLPADNGMADERTILTMGTYDSSLDFFGVKGQVEALFRGLRVRAPEFVAQSDNPSYHPGRCALIRGGDIDLGVMGQIHPLVCNEYGIDTNIYTVELDLGLLFELVLPEPSYTPLPRYPAVTRDIALICGAEIPASALFESIGTAGIELLESFTLFDVYTGDQVPEGKKSVAFSLRFRAKNRTLTDSDADSATAEVLAALGDRFGAYVR